MEETNAVPKEPPAPAPAGLAPAVRTGLLVLVGMALIVLLLPGSAGSFKAIEDGPRVDLNIPVMTLDGTPTTLQHLEGRPLFLKVWATWCGYCVEELPTVQAIARENQNGPVEVVTVITSDSLGRVQHFMDKSDYTFPVYIAQGELGGDLDVQYLPTTFLITEDQRLFYRGEGAQDWSSQKAADLLRKLAADG